MTRVLFVCTGNICRSPTAEGVARHFIDVGGYRDRIEVDSAGTNGYHAGEAPDPRTQKAALRRGYDLSALRARKIEALDFARFDLVLAMDRGHLDIMRRTCPEFYRGRLGLFMEYARNREFDEVPDPYYGGPTGFDAVLDMCEDAIQGLLESIARRG
ncbi:low molecular weight protein-tyrosine-phosphatase [Thauera sinica]|uniref:Low molecular weight protein-tyrosine-phosphatase n=1 Tax=Thauera sinica TaxID=2665146 RepID=A0ABW1AQY6_9RHOO|nr:low molecular weight protein-tyrosine-phosphatase [Thauera sp. K11]ATE59755.1 phosphotyrosine protein phosphatase [Thauera sp. K11]